MTHEINIIEKKKNPLFAREELIFEIEQLKTPSFAEVEEILNEKLKIDKKAVAIKEIKGLFGSRRFKVKAFLYESSVEKEKVEPKMKLKKTGELKEEKSEVKK